jgi:histidine triad (HIT) family protein
MTAADRDPDCPFCRLVHGEAPGHVVFEDEVSIAFLDHRPVFRGHTLLVPRVHVPTLLDLPSELSGPLLTNARRLAQAMETGLQADGSFVAVNNRVSQSVAHLHLHVIPRRRKDGLRGFFWPRQEYKNAAEMERIRGLLSAAVV